MEDSTELGALRDEVVRSSGLFALYATTAAPDNAGPMGLGSNCALVGRGDGLLAEHTFGHGVVGVTRHGLGVTGFGTSTS